MGDFFRRKVTPPGVEDHSRKVLEYLSCDFRTSGGKYRVYSDHYTDYLTLERGDDASWAPYKTEVRIHPSHLDAVIELLQAARERYGVKRSMS